MHPEEGRYRYVVFLSLCGNAGVVYVETLGLSTVFLEEFCTESLTVSMS